MRLLAAHRGESAPPPAVDPYLLVFDTWFADLAIGEGFITRQELIDQLLDLRLRLMTVHQLEDSLAGAPGHEPDARGARIDLPVDPEMDLRTERSPHRA